MEYGKHNDKNYLLYTEELFDILCGFPCFHLIKSKSFFIICQSVTRTVLNFIDWQVFIGQRWGKYLIESDTTQRMMLGGAVYCSRFGRSLEGLYHPGSGYIWVMQTMINSQ